MCTVTTSTYYVLPSTFNITTNYNKTSKLLGGWQSNHGAVYYSHTTRVVQSTFGQTLKDFVVLPVGQYIATEKYLLSFKNQKKGGFSTTYNNSECNKIIKCNHVFCL